jgi:hypothetical protein
MRLNILIHLYSKISNSAAANGELIQQNQEYETSAIILMGFKING